eukprot:5489861-Pleurochrysis_carterae.AAC.1
MQVRNVRTAICVLRFSTHCVGVTLSCWLSCRQSRNGTNLQCADVTLQEETLLLQSPRFSQQKYLTAKDHSSSKFQAVSC